MDKETHETTVLTGDNLEKHHKQNRIDTVNALQTVFTGSDLESQHEQPASAIEKIKDNEHLFLTKCEGENPYAIHFAFTCEKAGVIFPEEQKRAVNTIENFQINIVNWISNLKEPNVMFVQRFFFMPNSNSFCILFKTEISGKKVEETCVRAETLRLALNDLITLNNYHSFSEVKAPEILQSRFIETKDFDITEIKVGHTAISVDSKTKLYFSYYHDKISPSSSMNEFINLFLNKKNPSFIDVVFEKLSINKSEQKEIKSIINSVNNMICGKQWEATNICGLIQGRKGDETKENETIVNITPEKKEYILKLLYSVNSGNITRIRYFVGLDKNDYLGSAHTCFVKEYIGSVVYQTQKEKMPAIDGVTFTNNNTEKIINTLDVKKSRARVGNILGQSIDLQDIVKTGELVSLFKVPIPSEDGIQGMEKERLKILKISEKHLSNTGFVVGECYTARQSCELKISPTDLLRHLYVCGMTGTGKTTILKKLCFSLAEQGEGFTLLDPHGDMAREVLQYCSQKRQPEDIIYIDFGEENFNYGIDFFENDGTDKQKDEIVEQILGIIFRMINAHSMAGPIFEKYFRLVMKTLIKGGCSLSEFNRLVIDKEFRTFVINRIKAKSQDTFYIEKEFKEGDEHKSDGGSIWPYITSKMERFCEDPILKLFIGGSKKNLNFKSIMNNKKIFIVSFSTGAIPETTANTIGMLLTSKINLTAKERVVIPREHRYPYFLIIDEFQNFVAQTSNYTYNKDGERDLTSILSEARKYGLGLVLANQYIEQLGRGAKEAIFGNVGSKIVFRVGVEDGFFLSRHFGSGIAPSDFCGLPNFYGYISILTQKGIVEPFTIKTLI